MDYQNYSSPPPSSDLFPQQTIVYGAFWERFAAALLDGFILIIPTYVLQSMMGNMSGSVVSILVNWLYSALLEWAKTRLPLANELWGLR